MPRRRIRFSLNGDPHERIHRHDLLRHGLHNPRVLERLWRAAGIRSVLCFIVAYLVYDHQPQVGASADALADFYDGDRMRF